MGAPVIAAAALNTRTGRKILVVAERFSDATTRTSARVQFALPRRDDAVAKAIL